jgi:signal transduction histidine kinase/ligand-binding sensor domain-containing protein
MITTPPTCSRVAAEGANPKVRVASSFPAMHASRLWLLAIWFATCGSGSAQGLSPAAVPVSEDYVLRVWNMDDGIGDNDVWSIAQTLDGYLWLATGAGLVRFDGVRFTVVPTGMAAQPAPNHLDVVFAARNGDLWVAQTNGAVARRRAGRFESILPGKERSVAYDITDSIAQEGDGSLWLGYAAGPRMVCWRNGNLAYFPRESGFGNGQHIGLKTSTKGQLWFATQDLIGRRVGDRFETVDRNEAVRPLLAVARDGGMWTIRGGTIIRYRADGSREETADITWLGGAAMVKTIYEDRAGFLWIGTRGKGLYRFCPGQSVSEPGAAGGSFVRVPTASPYISTVTEDREGNLWAGTRAGLNRLRPRFLYLHQTSEGLFYESTATVCMDKEERLWAAGAGVLFRATDAQNQTFAQPANAPTNVTTLHAAPDGSIWLGGMHGLTKWKDGMFQPQALAEPLTSLLTDRRGALWAASIHGPLFHGGEREMRPWPETGGLVDARALAEDAQGAIWAGTESGLVFRHGLDQAAFAQVPLPGSAPGQPVRFIVPDGQETVWIGTLAGGIYRARAGRVKRLPPTAGLPVNDVRALATTPEGDLWLGTGRGLLRVKRAEVENALDGTLSVIRHSAYGFDDGFSAAGFSYGFLGAPPRAANGHLWFATLRGVLEIRPERVPHFASSPVPILIDEILINNKRQSNAPPRTLVIPPRPATVRLSYTLPQFRQPEMLRFRYRLTGYGSEDWVEMGTQREVIFTRLPPGRYHFEVAASEEIGQWLANAATLDFTVQAAWWETAIFRLSVAAAGIGALGWMIRAIERRRLRAHLRALESEQALERERARIARDMHDELGSSITRIAQMSDLAAAETSIAPLARSRLTEIAAAARSVGGTLDRVVWTVDPVNDTLDNLVGYMGDFITEYLETSGLDLKLELPATVPAGPIDSRTRHQILLVLKEALNNILKHANAGTVAGNICCADHLLTISLRDDGRGFDPASLSGTGNGLANMRQRIGSLGGEWQVASRAGGGTLLTFTVPLQHANAHLAARP